MASKRGIEAGRAYVRATLDDSLFRKGLNKMKGGLMSFGRALPSIASGIYIFQKLGNVVQSAASRITDAIDEIATIDRVRKAFGATAEQATGLFGVFKASGATNARENIESLVTLSSRIKDVMTGTGKESKKLFDGLSVSAEELSKLPIDEQFFRLHQAIMELPDPMDRVNRLMLAFGEDGGKTLIGTLSMSNPQLRELAKSFAMTSEETEAATRAQKAMAAASAAVQAVWNKIAVVIAPLIVQAIQGFGDAARWVNEWVRQNAFLQQSLKIIQSILGAMGVGQWAAAWKVAIASIQVVVAGGIDWLREAWITATSGIAMLFVNLAAQVESIWSAMTTGIVQGLLASVSTAFGILSGIASKFGLNDQAMQLGGLATGASIASGAAGDRGAADVAAIEKRRQQTQDTLAEDMAQRLEGGLLPKALEDLEAAMAEAKEATEANTQKVPDLPSIGEGSLGAMTKKADNAVNAAASVSSSAGNEAFVRAVTGIRGETEIQKDIAQNTAETAKGVNKLTKNYIVLTPARTA